MGDVSKLTPPGVHLSIKGFCDEAGCDRETIARRLRLLNVTPSARKRTQQLYRLSDLLRAAYLTKDDGSFDPSGLDPFKQKAYYQAQTERMRAMENAGLLTSAIDVETRLSHAFKLMALFLETVPDILERDCGLTPDQVASVESRIDTARTELHAALNTDSNDSRNDQLAA